MMRFLIVYKSEIGLVRLILYKKKTWLKKYFCLKVVGLNMWFKRLVGQITFKGKQNIGGKNFGLMGVDHEFEVWLAVLGNFWFASFHVPFNPILRGWE